MIVIAEIFPKHPQVHKEHFKQNNIADIEFLVIHVNKKGCF